tara:strand:+ start:441 stop:848 length:408 start_codon:yes stop_codon:yes gene_type:complete
MNKLTKISQNLNLDDIFILVKSVEITLGQHRVDLMLVLTDLPNTISTYHALGSNYIIMNCIILNAVSTLVKSKVELSSFVFSVLTYEYLHALGYIDEEKVRNLVFRVNEENLGRDHPATRVSSQGIVEIYPELKS